MMGRNHAWCGVLGGTGMASFVAPHRHGWFEWLRLIGPAFDGDLGANALDAAGLVGLFAAAVVLTLLLPGMALPEAWLPNAPPIVLGVLVATVGGAALLPDLDHPSATVARSLGPITRAVAWAIDHAAVGVYEATRGPNDRPKQNGHRLLTHTVPGAVAFGLVALGLMALPGVPLGDTGVSLPLGAAVPALLGALLALGAPGIGTLFAVTTAVASVVAFSQAGGWVPLLAAGVTVGCLAHVAGDMVTISGVPIMWPIERHGQRWRQIRTPWHFRVFGVFERRVVGPGVMGVTGVAVTVALAAVASTLGGAT